jgi:hypothetical protein
VGVVRSEQKISETSGGFMGVLDMADNLGESVASLGDLDGDGNPDLAVGAPGDDDGDTDQGAVWILFLNADGTVSSEQKISATTGGFAGDLDPGDLFGISVACVGDLDDDGIPDLAVGALGDDDGGLGNQGAVWILFLNADGTVAAEQKISATMGGFGGALSADGNFGSAVAALGDLDGDLAPDLAVGASADDGPGTNQGAAWILFLDTDGTVAAEQKIGEAVGGFGGDLDAGDSFGVSLALLGDLDLDGNPELAVGARDDDEGAVWLLFLNAEGMVASEQKISAATGGFEGLLEPGDQFGDSVASPRDLNGDGNPDLAVGAIGDDDGGTDQGAIWVLFLNADGTVAAELKISATVGGFEGSLIPGDRFGHSITAIGDLGASGKAHLAVGAPEDDDGDAVDQGALWILFLDDPTPPVLYQRKISDTSGGFGGTLGTSDIFGNDVEALGDLDADGVPEMIVGSPQDDAGGNDRGALWLLFMNADGTVKSHQKISDVDGGFTGVLDNDDHFGNSCANLGDLDGEGDAVVALAVGAFDDDDGGMQAGAVWILFLDSDGMVLSHQKISELMGGFNGPLADGDGFGSSVCSMGDLNGDGICDLAVGSWRDDDGGADRGAVWILLLNDDGTVKAEQKISDLLGSFDGTLANDDRFGIAVDTLGDIDGTGGSVAALAVGASQSDQGASDGGAVWILFLDVTGMTVSVASERLITESLSGFAGNLDAGDDFGAGLESLGDLDGDGLLELAVGARKDDDGAGDAGAVWLLSLVGDGTVSSHVKISSTLGNFAGALDAGDAFGNGLAALGDLDGDGRTDLAIGANADDDGVTDAGAVWICFLNDGTLALGANATTWTGATDTQWEVAGNWGNGVPDATRTAIVPDAATTPNDPVISVSGQECNTLWVQAGGTLDVSAGTDSLGVFGGATVSGPITGSGELVFEAAGVLAGNSTITLPLVRAAEDLTQQGGPLGIVGTLQCDADLAVEGALGISGSLFVEGLLSGAPGSDISITGGGGDDVRVGQICVAGTIVSNLPLDVDGSGSGLVLDVAGGWPEDVRVDVDGTITLLTAAFAVGGDLLLRGGTLLAGVNGSIDTTGANGVVIEDLDALGPLAVLDITGVTLSTSDSITVGDRGKLNIGPGGVLELGGSLTVESGGTLCLDGEANDVATLTSSGGNRYTLTFLAGTPAAKLAAQNFAFTGMSAAGIAIPDFVELAPAPLDLRGGLFDDPEPGGVLLDIERTAPTELRYLTLDNSLAAATVKNVRCLSGAPITLVNWSGDLASDATTAEMFDDDPGETTPPERVLWAPPESSAVTFSARWGPDHVKAAWTSTSEVDSEAYVLERSPDPPGTYVTLLVQPSSGPGIYRYDDFGVQAQAGYRYRLYERLTHGALRLIDEETLAASGAPNVLRPVWGRPGPPPPPPLPLVVGPGGSFPDVRTALRSVRGPRVELVLARGVHGPFEIGPECAFDIVLTARPGAVIDASNTPVRIHGLAAEHALELRGLYIDARGATREGLLLEDTLGVVLLDAVTIQGDVRLAGARAVAIQGGAMRSLALERGSVATASGLALEAIELAGFSRLETRGMSVEPRVEPGSCWLARGRAPGLELALDRVTVGGAEGSIAWLLAADGLGFHLRPAIEGALLLEPRSPRIVGPGRLLAGGRAMWSLGSLPSGAALYLQALTLDGGRMRLSSVVRLEAEE